VVIVSAQVGLGSPSETVSVIIATPASVQGGSGDRVARRVDHDSAADVQIESQRTDVVLARSGHPEIGKGRPDFVEASPRRQPAQGIV